METKIDLATTNGRTEAFFEALRSLHSIPHLAGDAKVSVDTLRTITSQADARSVVAGGLPTPAKMLVEAGLKGTKHAFVEDLKATEAIGVLSKADVGVSWAACGSAKEGALVEVTYDDSVKLVSALPRVSVILLSSRELLPDMRAAVDRVAQIIRAGGSDIPVVSIISGPSKTADIELRLLYGVHGPHELHVLLLDWL